jgi:hypothetical protein
MGPEEGNFMKKSELQEMTKAELDDLARDNEIEGRSAMNKDELVDALAKVRGGGKSTKGETIMTTPRENQDSLGYHTREGEEDLTFEQPPADEESADSTSLGGSVTGTDVDTATAPVANP